MAADSTQQSNSTSDFQEKRQDTDSSTQSSQEASLVKEEAHQTRDLKSISASRKSSSERANVGFTISFVVPWNGKSPTDPNAPPCQ